MQTIYSAWFLAQKDLRCFLRDKTALVLSILVPIALVSVFGWIMAYAFGGGSGGMPKISLHVADLAGTDASQKFFEALEGNDMVRIRRVVVGQEDEGGEEPPSEEDTLRRLEEMVRGGDAHHILVIPADFSEQISASEVPQLRMLRDPGRLMEDRIVKIAVIQAATSQFGGSIFTNAMDQMLTDQGMDAGSVGQIRSWMTDIGSEIGGFYESKSDQPGEVGDADRNGTGAGDATTGQSVSNAKVAEDSLESTKASSDDGDSSGGGMDSLMEFMDQAVPMETTDIAPPNRSRQVTYQQAQSVAGMTVMMLLFALTSCGSVLLTEREEGTLKRLFAQPMSRNAILLGKFFFVLIVGLAQMAILFTYGEWMFGVGLFRDPFTLVVLSVSWVLTGGAFGVFLASVSRSTKQAESLASLLILMMAALGGCWFPLQNMDLPPVLEIVCKSTMTFWAMTGFQNMLWFQLSWTEANILEALVWQWGWAIVLGLGSIYFFRRNFCRG